MKIKDIQSPSDIKSCSIDELKELATEIRTFLVENIANTGGHLSSNLGIVELCIALHYVFDSPSDKIFFDVGHQSYVHKILTGRANQFSTLRQLNGLSGFQKRIESVHDVWEAGHSSTALSAALGFCMARDLDHQNFAVIPVVGDASMMSGISLEALNSIGMKKSNMIIVLNDNEMSISRNIGALSDTFTRLRTSDFYTNTKSGLNTALNKNKAGKDLYQFLKGMKDSIKKNVVESSFFDDFGVDYIGPIHGHDLNQLIHTFKSVKHHHGPIVVHVATKKGKGYEFAENDFQGKWHGVSPFNPRTGQLLSILPENVKSMSEIVSDALCEIAADDKDVIAITPAMSGGSKLGKFESSYPNRFIDCGIAEDHAAILAASLALNQKKPFLALYSSFLQRAYDPINHDIARMDLPVVIGIDRAGLVGEDGETHHGVFDVSILRSLPHLIIAQGKNAVETRDLLYTAFNQSHPFALRYARANIETSDEPMQLIEIGSWEKLQIGNRIDCIVVAYGCDVPLIEQKARVNHCNLLLVNARFFKPLDTQCIDELVALDVPMIVYESDILSGGLASSMLEYCNDQKLMVQIERIGIEDHYVQQGSLSALRIQQGIDLNSLFEKIGKYLHD